MPNRMRSQLGTHKASDHHRRVLLPASRATELCDPEGAPSMNRLTNPFAPRRALPEKTQQIKVWTREVLYLDDEVVVSITELVCRDNDCPDIETVIGIMRPGEKIETIRIHKAIAEVELADLVRHVQCD